MISFEAVLERSLVTLNYVFHHNSNQTIGPYLDRNNKTRKVTGSIKQIIDKMFEDFYDQNMLISTLEDQDLSGALCLFVCFFRIVYRYFSFCFFLHMSFIDS